MPVQPIVLLSLSLLVNAAPAGSWQPPGDAHWADTLPEVQRLPTLAERLVRVSDALVGAPYQVSPLGEGEGTDPDPRFRVDAFDCTTFVETTLALALARDLPEARRVLDALRYRGGEAHFLRRRHFPAAEWLPELSALGFLADITREVGGREVVIEKKVLNPQVWARRKRPSHLELPPERIPSGTFSLTVWPLDAARRDAQKIPPGTLLNLVRVDFKSVPVRISHQGIVIDKGGKRYLRHAADRMYHSVVDEPIDRFFYRMQQYKQWPVAGVHLARFTEPPAWRRDILGLAAEDDRGVPPDAEAATPTLGEARPLRETRPDAIAVGRGTPLGEPPPSNPGQRCRAEERCD